MIFSGLSLEVSGYSSLNRKEKIPKIPLFIHFKRITTMGIISWGGGEVLFEQV